MRATFPAHLIILDFITRIIFDEEYISLSSSLRSFLQMVSYTYIYLFIHSFIYLKNM